MCGLSGSITLRSPTYDDLMSIAPDHRVWLDREAAVGPTSAHATGPTHALLRDRQGVGADTWRNHFFFAARARV